MKKAVYIFLILAIPVSVNAYAYVRTLQVGSEGEDVRELQRFLNSNPATQIGTEGIGSSSNESMYFGEKTKQSVIKLQNLFADIILKPAGLIAGSGFVGTNTLNFLNSVQNGSTLTVPISNSSTLTPTVDTVTPLNVQSGDIVTIIGTNFSEDNNTLIIGFESKTAYMNIPSTENGTKIEFTYVSSIQTTYDTKYGDLSKKIQQTVKEKFQPVPIAVSVIPDGAMQSNFKIINFILQ